MPQIAVFIDGTKNEANPPETDGRTSVRRMFEEVKSLPENVCLYLPGVGCEAVAEMDLKSSAVGGLANAVELLLNTERLQKFSFGGLFGEWFGVGLTARVLAAYAFICAAREQYPTARICIVGFSRGAYACCVLAHFMERAGLIVAKSDFGLYADVVRDAWTYDDKKLAEMLQSGKSREWQLPNDAESIKVDFLGCWDTVCAMGAPEYGIDLDIGFRLVGKALDGLCGFIHGKVKSKNPRFVSLFLPPNVIRARHALALHEYRVAFEPLIWSPPSVGHLSSLQDITQMWFPGAHADVGGGYVETQPANVSNDHAFNWMKGEMWQGLPDTSRGRINIWPIHDSSVGKFRRMKPKVRRSLTYMTADQVQTMKVSDWLQFGLKTGLRVLQYDENTPLRTSAPLVAFRPEIESLHQEAHILVLSLWLRAELARAAVKHNEGTIPIAFIDPTATESLEALSEYSSGFMRSLDAAGLAAMVNDRDLSKEMTRLCCYHLCLTQSPVALINAGRDAIMQAQGEEEKSEALQVLKEVFLAPLAFALGRHIKESTECLLAIDVALDIKPTHLPKKVIKL